MCAYILYSYFKKNIFGRLFRRIQSYKFSYNYEIYYFKDFLQKNAKDVNSDFQINIRIFDLIFLKEFLEKYMEFINISETDPLKIVISKINIFNTNNSNSNLNSNQTDEFLILNKVNKNSNIHFNNINNEDREKNIINLINSDLYIFGKFYDSVEKDKIKALRWIENFKNKRVAKNKFLKANLFDNIVNIKINPFSYFFKSLTKNIRSINKIIKFNSNQNLTNNAFIIQRNIVKNDIVFIDSFLNINDNQNENSILSDDSNDPKFYSSLEKNINLNSNAMKRGSLIIKNENRIEVNDNNIFLDNREDTKIKILKCDYCRLPLSYNFFNKQVIEASDEKMDWECGYCLRMNKYDHIICINSLCNKIKKINNRKNFLFKKLKIPFSNKDIEIFEKALFNLPNLNAEENIFKACLIQLQKNKEDDYYLEQEKKIALENFVNLINKNIGNNAVDFIDNPVSDLNNFINELNFNSAKNYEAREKHRIYLSKIREIINFMRQILNVANNFLENFKELNLNYFNSFFLDKFVLEENINKIKNNNFSLNNFLNNIKNRRKSNLANARKKSVNLNINNINQIADLNSQQKNVSNKNKYKIIYLIKQKVIENVNIAHITINEFIKRSYLIIEKSDYSFNFKITYKEPKKNLFSICNKVKNEYIVNEFSISYIQVMELRRFSGFNSFFTRSDIRFNAFYLVELLNGM